LIVRRIVASFRNRNVSHLVAELLIVIVGVFIGIQVSNWNDERIEQSRASSYLERIRSDLDADIDNFRDRLAFWQKVSGYGELGLHYANTGDSRNASQWDLLLAYFQASQLAEFYTSRTTYDELKSGGALSLIYSLELRDQLARYYNESGNPVLTERPAYRERIRGLLPLHVQNYIWEQCYSSDAYSQTLLECEAPINNEEAAALVATISKNEPLMSELRYWMSTMRVAQNIGIERTKLAQRLRNMVDESASAASMP
jgi:hypothetical protein